MITTIADLPFHERPVLELPSLAGDRPEPDPSIVNPALEVAGDARVGRDEIRRFWANYRRALGQAQSRFAQITSNEEAAGLFWTTATPAAAPVSVTPRTARS